MAWFGTNMEKCDRQLATPTLATPYLYLKTLETVRTFEEGATTSQAWSI